MHAHANVSLGIYRPQAGQAIGKRDDVNVEAFGHVAPDL